VLFGNIHPEKLKRKTGSFGKPISPDLGRIVKIADDNNGEDFITKGYWQAPKANKDAFDEGRVVPYWGFD